MSADSLLKADWERCNWTGCKQQAVAAYNDVAVIPEHSNVRTHVGRVALCREHLRRFTRDKYLRLDWDRVL